MARKATKKSGRPSSMKVSAAAEAPASKAKDSQERFPAESLPRRALQQCLRVAETLHKVFAGKATPWDDLAQALEIGSGSPNTRYLFFAAVGYGIISKDGQVLSLTETGRKIVAPTYEGEAREGIIKALLTPSVLSKFYTDYSGHSIPGANHLPNVLESRYGVPRTRLEEAQTIIVANADFADLLRVPPTGGEAVIDLSGTGVAAAPAPEDQSGTPAQVATPASKAAWDKICFFITPIGEDGSEPRKHADMMLKHLIEPALEEFKLDVVRADKIDKSGLITQQIFEHLVKSRLCVADMSFNNPNAFYELGIRHMSKRPTVQLIRRGDKIPFDVAQGRTIVVDTSDVYTVMDRFLSARRELIEHVRNIMSSSSEDPGDDNPVNVYLPGLKVALPK